MVRNPERRTALLYAAIDVLAKEGARGLTFRAVDREAGVPTGTASNYFSSRDDLLGQCGEYVFVRLTPAEEEVARHADTPPSRELEVTLMRDIVDRARRDREGFLAMMELRLEANRRPALREALTGSYRANLEGITAAHVDGGFPGNRTTAVLLYLAMNGLLLEYLTVPETLADSDEALDALVADLVRVIVPPA